MFSQVLKSACFKTRVGHLAGRMFGLLIDSYNFPVASHLSFFSSCQTTWKMKTRSWLSKETNMPVKLWRLGNVQRGKPGRPWTPSPRCCRHSPPRRQTSRRKRRHKMKPLLTKTRKEAKKRPPVRWWVKRPLRPPGPSVKWWAKAGHRSAGGPASWEWGCGRSASTSWILTRSWTNTTRPRPCSWPPPAASSSARCRERRSLSWGPSLDWAWSWTQALAWWACNHWRKTLT